MNELDIVVEGVHPGELPDESAVVKRAFEEWRLVEKMQARRETQKIIFSSGPIALIQFADLHLGDGGVNYPRLWEETKLVANMPGAYVIVGGDVTNDFIIGSLRQARDEARFSIPDEWALFRAWLRIIAHKIKIAVAGNHNNWPKLLTGMDYFEDVLGDWVQDALYDPDEVVVDIIVGDFTQKHKIRHIWRGSSIYNDTHGVERSAKFDSAFDVGWASHTHASGLVRSFNVEGRTGWSMLSGSYKRVDTYARRRGFRKPNKATAVGLLIDPDERTCVGFDNLRMLDKYMRSVYG